MNRVLSTATSAGKLIVRAYLNHLLWFTIGVVAGSIQTFFILAKIWGPL